MKNIQFLLTSLLLLFPAFIPLTRASEPAKPATIVKAAYTSLAGSKLPLWLATDRGYFKERGIEVEPIFLRTLTAVQALITGDVKFAYTGCAELMSARKANPDIKIIGNSWPYNPYMLVARSEISDPKQLVGKRIAINSLRDLSHVSARVALHEVKVDPDKLTYVPTGSTPERVLALRAGAVDAIMFGGNANIIKGFNILVDLSNRKIPDCIDGIGVSDSWMRSNAHTTEAFMRGMVKGAAFLVAGNADQVLAVLARYTRSKVGDGKVESTYQFIKERATADLTVQPRGVRSVLDVLGQQDPSWLSWKEEQFYDNSIMDKLRREGFLEVVFKQL
jgi:ABC-type nitrate/sulfonate/bicarbonate transport system substrate-binding protein